MKPLAAIIALCIVASQAMALTGSLSRLGSFEDLPATESQHSYFPEPQSALMKANSLCHRGARPTNGHLITPPRSGNELEPVQSIELHLLTLAR
jgi:hypothetical protein